MQLKTKREEVVELINKLFVYTDSQQWDNLVKEVFKEKVLFDMTSLGSGPAKEMTAVAICDLWRKGFVGIDHVHHQSGNFIVDFNEESVEADVFCYAIASHYRQSATKGKTREFTGSYRFHAAFTDLGWRLDSFQYNLKFITGNEELK